MQKDLMYLFDKKTFKRSILGEVQSGFNMSMVLDGTKDSISIMVWGFQESEIEPYTILYHAHTETWWVVNHDKVETYAHDNGKMFVHNLELLGAIELLNARDLTDCGFDNDKYTTYQFIKRLFALSTFEFNKASDTSEQQGGDNVNLYITPLYSDFLDKNVDFIKSFENYTLLSALREFLDQFNYACKLDFVVVQDNGEYYLESAVLRLKEKTGDRNHVYDIDEFDDVRETKTMNANSYGSTVVSNAENVISAKAKTFPATGSVMLSSTQGVANFNDNIDNAVIRLPSNVYKGNWLELISNSGFLYIDMRHILPDIADERIVGERYNYNPTNSGSFDKLIEYLFPQFQDDDEFAIECKQLLLEQRDRLESELLKASTIRLFNGNKIVPVSDSVGVKIEKGENVPYLVKVSKAQDQETQNKPIIFCDEDTRNSLQYPKHGIQWKRGSNIISGFKILERTALSYVHTTFNNTKLGQEGKSDNYVYFTFTKGNNYLTLKLPSAASIEDTTLWFYPYKTSFVVNYIPMTDIKIKKENGIKHNDIHLYNQTGRLTDAIALSKLINSYAKEISSDTITKFKTYYSFDVVPPVGSIVMSGNIEYVINNVSMDFTTNEYNALSNGYCIECEFTMSKNVAVKSLMVSPNTDIRDYGIPQNFNVKRKQLYRDYYELSYSQESSEPLSSAYLDYTRIFNFTNTPNEEANFIATIDIEYNEPIGSETSEGSSEGKQSHWYFQLETTNYYLNKSFYVIVDFNDNNIIGYGGQNVFSGFDISRIFTGMVDQLTTPISYVDENGEFKGITLRLSTNQEITTAYDNYQNAKGYGSDTDYSLYNYSVLIDRDFVNDYLVENDYYSIEINEPNYDKDAIEVPVFEYVCEIGDNDNVLIGDNIFNQHEGFVYFYSYVVGNNLNQNNAKPNNHVIGAISPVAWSLSDSITFDTYEQSGETFLRLQARSYTRYLINEGTWSYGPIRSLIQQANKDIAVFRHAFNLATQEEIVELMFIAKKVPSERIATSRVILYINFYKLK